MKWVGMKHAAFALLALVGACASNASTESNPSTLWLATNADETQMQLVGVEPHPF